MNVGVMKDYKLRDLRASHTLYCFEKVRGEHFFFFSSFLFPTRLTSGSCEGGPEGSDFAL